MTYLSLNEYYTACTLPMPTHRVIRPGSGFMCDDALSTNSFVFAVPMITITARWPKKLINSIHMSAKNVHRMPNANIAEQ